MMIEYVQNTGEFFINGIKEETGFSGAPGYINNPEFQCLKNKGPLPRGWYIMTDEGFNKTSHAIRLTPTNGTDMCGRDGMLIHGDKKSVPGTGSTGCIILSRSLRLRILDIIRDNNKKNKKTVLEVR